MRFVTSRKDHLKQPQSVNHEGFIYECDNCEFRAGYKSNLKKHKAKVHSEFNFTCDSCDFKSAFESQMKQHFEINIKNFI